MARMTVYTLHNSTQISCSCDYYDLTHSTAFILHNTDKGGVHAGRDRRLASIPITHPFAVRVSKAHRHNREVSQPAMS